MTYMYMINMIMSHVSVVDLQNIADEVLGDGVLCVGYTNSDETLCDTSEAHFSSRQNLKDHHRAT